MFLQRIWSCLALGAGLIVGSLGGDAVAQATIEGTVPITGGAMSPPPSPKYQLKAGSVASSPRQVAVVYLEGKFGAYTGDKTVTFGQKGYQFNPGVIAIQTGTRVSFPNFDDDYHILYDSPSCLPKPVLPYVQSWLRHIATFDFLALSRRPATPSGGSPPLPPNGARATA